MDAETDSRSWRRRASGPRETSPGGPGTAADDEVVAWVSGPAEPGPPSGDEGCPTCGFAGELLAGPDALTCPACQAEYPKIVPGQGPVLMMVRCAGCGLAIGVVDRDRDRTLVCPRCKYFLGCVLHRISRKPWRS